MFVAPRVQAQFVFGWASLSDATAEEGGTLRFRLDLNSSSGGTFDWIVTGVTATAGVDWPTTSTSGSVTVPGGEAAFIEIPTTEDVLAENDETLTLTVLRRGARDLTATGTITDDDPITVAVEADQQAVVEGNSALFTVSLGGGTSTEAVTVQFNVGGTATAGEDHTFPTGDVSLTIPAGASRGAISVEVLTDDLQDAGETIVVELTSASTSAGSVSISSASGSAQTSILNAGEGPITFGLISDAVDEGGVLVFRLAQQGAARVTLFYTTSDGTAVAGEDYEAATGSVSFIPDGSVGIRIQTIDDELIEGDETLTVTVTGGWYAGFNVNPMTATGTILNDDQASVSIEDATAAEGSTLEFPVTLSEALPEDLVLDWSTEGVSASSGGDFTEGSGTLTIAAGELRGTIEVATVDDELVEAVEAMTVGIRGNNLTRYATVTGPEAVGSITDNDELTASVSADAPTAAEGGIATFTVTLAGGRSTANVLVDFSVTGSASRRYDYIRPATRLSIPAGEQEGKIEIPILIDASEDAGETVVVTLTGASTEGSASVDAAPATTTIEDGVRVSVGDAVAVEGGALLFPVTVASRSAVELRWTTENGTAMAGQDYTAVSSGSLTVGVREIHATLRVETVEDTFAEPDESMTVRITSATSGGATLGAGVATGTIIDDDAGIVVLNVEGERTTFREGESVVFQITRLPAAKQLRVGIDVSGHAKIMSSATRVIASDPTGAEVVMAAGVETASLTLTTEDDNVNEGDGVIGVAIRRLTLESSDGSHPLLAPNGVDTRTEAEVYVVDDDILPVSLEVDNEELTVVGNEWTGTVVEGTRVEWRVACRGDVVQGGSTAPDRHVVAVAEQRYLPHVPSDFSLHQVGFLRCGASWRHSAPYVAGVAQGEIRMVLLPFSAIENAHASHTHTMTGAVATTDESSACSESEDRFCPRYTISGPSTIRAAILNRNPRISVEPVEAEIDEGETARFRVRRAWVDDFLNPSEVDLLADPTYYETHVEYRTAQEETYAESELPGGELTFAPRATEVIVEIPTVDDDLVAEDGSITFEVSEGSTVVQAKNRAASYERVSPYSAAVVVRNTDLAAVSVGDATAEEGETLEFPVTLSAPAPSDVVLGWTTSDGTATAGDDYTPVSDGTLTIAAGETTGTLSVSTIEDALVEDDETFTVTITGTTLPAGVEIAEDGAAATGTIEEGKSFSVSVADAEAPEGIALEFPVTLSGEASSDVVLTWSTSDGTATAGDDYTEVAGGVTAIRAGETEVTLRVPTLPDTLAEGDETFTVTIVGDSLPRNVEVAEDGATATGTIVDDDTVTLAVADAEAPEGMAVEFPVTLSGEASSDVVLTWSTSAVTATAGDDYTEVTAGTLTIPAGETSGTLSVPTAQDTLVEIRETFTVTIAGELPPGVEFAEDGAAAIGTIDSDDLLTLSVADAAAAEGSPVEFPVALIGDLSEEILARLRQGEDNAGIDVTLTWSTSDGTATADDDYTPVSSGTLTIQVGGAAGTLSVSTIEDAVAEGDETFEVTIAADSLPLGVTLGTSTATGTIENDDSVTVSVGAATAEEGSPLEFPVTLSGEASSDVVLTWSTSDGTATADDDYAPVSSGTVTILAGATSGTLSVSTIEDAVAEDAETFEVTIAADSLPAGVTLGTSTATGTIENDDSVTVSVGAATAEEGSPVEFPVTLSGAASSDVVLTWSTSDGTATADDDYTPVSSGTLTILAGETSGTLSVSTIEDAVAEDAETFEVTIAADSLPSGVTLGTSTATGTIENDDSVTVSVGAATAEEGSPVEFPVTLSGEASSDVVLTWSTSDGTATADDDYAPVSSGTVTILAGATSGTLSVSTIEDAVAEDAETFEVTIAADSLPAGVTLGTSTATGTIENDDSVTVSVGAATAEEGSPVEFPVTLSGAASSDVVLTWSTSDGTATADDDYTPVSSGTLTILAGETSGTLSVSTIEDAVAEDAETFEVTIAADSLPSGVTLGTSTATGTIENDDSVTVSVGAATAEEGSPVEFPVTLSGEASSDVVLTWSTSDGTATADDDYAPVSSGTVTILAGATSGTLSVSTIEDAVAEDAETFEVTIAADSLPAGVTLGTSTATGTIENDDSVTVSVGAATAEEGSPVEFPVTLSGAASSDVVLTWSTSDGTATADDDYTPVSSGTLTILAGETSGTLSVSTIEDAVAEDAETFEVTIAADSLPAGVTLGTSTATGTIENDDSVTVSVGAATAEEGSPVEFPVTLSGAASSDTVLTWSTSDGTAVSGDDYTEVSSGTVTIPAGATSGTLSVPTVNDALVEGDETFTVTIAAATLPAGVTLGTSTATGTIEDDDSLTASVSASADTVTEGPGASAAFTVTLSGGESTASVEVTYTVDGTASPGTDYEAPSGTLTILAGQSSGTISIPILADEVLDPDETVVVSLTGASTAKGSVSASGQATVTIAEAGMATVSVGAASASEGTALEFPVTQTIAASSDTVLTWSTSDGTAVSGDDYTEVSSGTVTIPAGATSGTLSVPTVNDALVEGDETFTVTIAAATLPAGVTLGTSTATGTIEDDDSLTASVSASADTVTEGPGASAAFTVTLSGGESTASVEVTYTVDGTASPGTDYEAPSGTLTILAGQSSGTISIPILADEVLDPDETVVVSLTGASTAKGSVSASGQATVTIAEAGMATVSVGAASASEGTALEFPVTQTIAASSDTVLTWSTSDGTAVSGDDYTEVSSGTVTIPAGATSGTLSVPTVNDALVEGDETFTVTIAAATLPAGVTLGTSTATGTIEDDDSLTASVSASADTVTEGPGASAAFTVTLSGGESTASVEVTYTVDGTASPGTDYEAPSGTLTILAGQSSGTISIPILADEVLDPDETVVVSLTGASTAKGSVSASGQATVTIRDPAASSNSHRVSVGGARASEGTALEFPVTQTIAASSDTVLTWSTSDGTAVSGDDYTEVSSGTVTIPAGATSGTLSVPTVNDALVEGDETFTVTIAAATLPAGVTLGTSTATGTIEDDDSLTASVSASADTVTEGPGASAAFTVTLSGGESTASVEVTYTVDGTASPGTDYEAPSGTLTILAGQSSGTISIPILADEVLDPDETVVVSLTGASTAKGSVSASGQATVTIRDPAASSNSHRVSVGGARASEGTALEFPVTQTIAASSDTVLTWSTSDGTAVSGDDYTEVSSGTVTIPAGATSGTLSVPTVNDALVEGDETFTVTIAAATLPAGVTLGTSTATGTIEDDDSLTASVSASADTVTEGPGASAAFTVTLSGGESTASVEVTYTVDGTASPGTDYEAPSGTLTILAGQSSGTISIPILADEVLDPDETVVVSLTGASTAKGSVSASGQATVTIAEAGMATVSVGAASASEGTALEFPVTQTIAASSDTVLTWSTSDGTAVSGDDYTEVSSGTVTIPAGATSGTLSVPTVNDALVEGDETFTVTIAAATLPAGVTLGTSTATGTIEDDDSLTASVSASADTVTEGPGASAAFTVTLSGGESTASVEVTYTVDGTASPGTDYEAPSGTLTILAGQSSGTISIPILADEVLDPDETVVVSLTGASTAKGSVSASGQATVTIAEAGMATVSVGAASASEGTALEFPVTQTIAASSDTVLTWSTSDGTAVSGDDYTEVSSGTVTIPAGATSGTLSVPTVNDALVEGDETFTVTIAAATLPAGVTLGTSTATGTIEDDDSLTASVSASADTVTEGPGASAAFTVTLSGGESTASVEVTYTVDGTASPGTDYEAPSGTLTILAGQSSGTISIPILADEVLDPDETVVVSLTGASTAKGSVSASGQATVTIRDPAASSNSHRVSVGGARASEGTALEFPVTQTIAASSDTVLTWSTSDGTAVSGDDYTEVSSGTVTIPAGATSGTLSVPTVNDALVEGDETFTVTIAAATLPAGVTLGTSTATGTIEDDDSLTASVSASADTVTEGPGASAAFTVTLSGGESTASVEVTYTVDGTASPGTDYEAPSGTLTILAGQSSGTISIPILADEVLDPDETVVVSLTGASTAKGSVSASGQATVTIAEAGMATVSVGAASASEGTALEFPVTQTIAASSDTVLTWSTSDGTAVSGDDYTEVSSGTVTIPAGATSGTLSVPTVNDALVEGDETFTVTIAAATLPAGVTLGTSTATGTIEDDDSLTASVSASADTVTEGPGASAAFTVTLSGGESTASVEVTYTVDGTASPGTDYEAPSGTLTILAGQSSGTISIPILADEVLDPDETVVVSLTGASTAKGSVSASGQATVTIAEAGMATVSVGAASASEGTALEFPVTQTIAASSDTVLTWSTSDGTAVSGDDYTEVSSGTVTIPAGATSGTLSVPTVNDALVEGDETFTVTIAAATLPAGVTLGTSTATGTIEDDDSLTASVSAAADTVTEGPGASAAFTVTLSGGESTASVEVTYTVDGTASPGTDYEAPSGTLTILAGQSSGTISIPILADEVLDPDETVVVSLTGASTAKGSVSASGQATVTIAEAGMATVSVGAASASEGTALEFPVTQTIAASSDTVLTWSTSDGTAVSGDDYTEVSSGTVTIPAGATSGTLSVPTVNDALVEGDETFTVTIAAATLPAGVTLGTSTATGTIEDDDSLTASVSAAADTVTEGPGASAAFTVTLSGGESTASVEVTYTVDGTASPGTDYEAPSGTLTILAGQSSGTISIPILADEVLDPDETVVVSLTGASTAKGSVSASGQATVTIAEAGMATVSVGAASASEGTALEFPVTQTIAASSDTVLTWSTSDGTAVSGDDYTEVSSGTVTIPAGATSGTLSVPTVNDALVEGDETFTVTIAAATLPAGVTLGTSTATGTIEDDDSLTASVSASADTVTEGPGASAAFTVTLSGGESTASVEVTYTVDGTASPGTDYEAPSGTLTILAGQSSGTISIPILADEVLDPDETVVVSLTGASTAKGSVSASGQATVTIRDPAASSNSHRVSVGGARASEGTALEFPVTQTIAASSDTVLTWSTSDGTAVSGDDYTEVSSGTVTIPAGATSGTLSVPTVNDALVEGDETFTVTIAAATLPAGVTLGTSTATGTIEDDDSLTASVSASADTVTEGPGASAAFTVTLSGGESTASVEVTYTVDGTASPGTDYEAPSGTLTILAGQSSGTISIPILADEVLDPDETVVVSLTGASTAKGSVSASGQATVTIAEAGMATVSVGAASASEGTALEFPVTQTIAASSDTVLTWSTSDGTAVSGDDYTEVSSGTVTIPAGATSGTLSVPTVNDALVEGDETFTVTIAAATLPAGVTLGTSTATGTIEDDDSLTASVSAAADTVTEGPGASAAFTVTLSGGESTASVEVTYTVDGTASPGTDYEAPSGTLTILAGQSSGTISIPILADEVLDPDETVVVSLTGASTAKGSVSASGQATVTIAEAGMATVSVGAASASEGTALEFPVTQTIAASSDTVLTWSTSDGTAVSGDDYTEVSSGTVTIPAGATSGTLSVPTVNDALVEGDETFTVTIAAATLPAGVTLGTSTATGTILERQSRGTSQQASLQVSPATVREGEGGVTIEVAAVLGGAPLASDVEITVTVAGGSATEGADFEPVPAFVVTIAAGESSATAAFALTAIDDFQEEPPETVVLTGAAGSPDLVVQGTSIEIVDALPSAPTGGDSGGSVFIEGTTIVGATLTAVPSLPNSAENVDQCTAVWSADSEVIAGAAGLQYVLTEAEVGTMIQVTVGCIDPDGNEVPLTSAPVGPVRSRAQPPPPPPPILTIAPAASSVVEGSTVEFIVTRSHTATELAPFSVSVSETNSVLAAASPARLRFSAGAATTLLELATVDDETDEPASTVRAALLEGADYELGAESVATVSVRDNDAPPMLTVAPAAAMESDSSVAFVARLERPSAYPIKVAWSTSDGAAVAGVDYVRSAGELAFPAAAAELIFSVPLMDDDIAEADEDFAITLGDMEKCRVHAVRISAMITDDDAPPSEIVLSLDRERLSENAGPTAVSVAATLSGGMWDKETRIDVELSGSGAPGSVDYTAADRLELTIPAGELSGSTIFTLTPIDDDVDEQDEIIQLSGTSSLPVQPASLLIEDDDEPSMSIVVSVLPDAVQEDAGPTVVTVTAALDQSTRTSDTAVRIAFAGTGLPEAVDYTAVDRLELTIPAGERSGSTIFTLTPIDDDVDEQDEIIQLSGTSSLPVQPASLLIEDDDEPSMSIVVSVLPDAVQEDAGPTVVTVTAALDQSTRTSDTAVRIAFAGTGLPEAVDYTAVDRLELTIPAGERSGSTIFTLTPIDDDVDEQDEIIQLSGTSSLPVERASLLIEDDDEPSTSIVLSVLPDAVQEDAGPTVVTVTAALDQSTRTSDTAVRIAFAGTGLPEAVDYTAVDRLELTIPAGERSGSTIFTLTPIDDDVDEQDEIIQLSGTSSLPVERASLLIEDDDEPSTSIVLSVLPDAVQEDAGPTVVTVTAALDQSTRTSDTAVRIAFAGTGLPEAVDYTAVDRLELTIPAGERSGSTIFTLTPIDDDVDEQDEIIQLSGTSSLPVERASLLIEDDDEPSTSIILSAVPRVIQENDGPTIVTVTAALDLSTRTSDTAVRITASGSGAADAVGFEPVDAFTVTIPAERANGSATFRLTPVNDRIEASPETITLNGEAALSVSATSISLVDDDDATAARVWLSRFARTVASQVVDMAEQRIEGGSTADHLTLGGYSLLSGHAAGPGGSRLGASPFASSGWSGGAQNGAPLQAGPLPVGATSGGAGWLQGHGPFGRASYGSRPAMLGGRLGGGSASSPQFGSASGWGRQAPAFSLSRYGPDQRWDLLARSSFSLSSRDEQAPEGEAGEAGNWTAWGRGATTNFRGSDDSLSFQGDVVTGLVGVDYERGRFLAGLAVGSSRGKGDVGADGRPTAEATLTGGYPYMRVQVSEKLTVWGILGYGRGGSSLFGDGIGKETDISLTMSALGARRGLAAWASGFGLGIKSDVLLVRIDSEAAPSLAAVSQDVSRARLALQASYNRPVGAGTLAPSLEVGVRQDGGDAESGRGLEVGVGLRYSNPDRGLTVDLASRSLLTHQASDFRERGWSASIGLDPGEHGRGLAVGLRSSEGAAHGGIQQFWSQQQTFYRPGGPGFDQGGRTEVEVGYGLGRAGGRYLLSPYGVVLLAGEGEGGTGAGVRYDFAQLFSLSLEVARRRGRGEAPNDAVILHATLRRGPRSPAPGSAVRRAIPREDRTERHEPPPSRQGPGRRAQR